MKRIPVILSMMFFSLGLGAQQKYLLENEKMQVEVDLDRGTLIGLQSKMTGWNLIEDEKAACSFEANIKFTDGSFHVINAFSQEHPKVTIQGNAITFVWETLKVGGKQLDVNFEGTITMTPDGLVYGGKLTNNSDATIRKECCSNT